MEKLMNIVRSDSDGSRKLPPGFIFQPTDQEIVFQYLARKVFSRRLPASVIPEIDNIFTLHHPSDLPGDSEQERYFFSNTKTNHHHHRSLIDRIGRKTSAGYWKAVTGSDKQIGCCSQRTPIVGIRKTLVFYEGKHPFAARTDWFMHLYCIAISRNSVSNIQQKRHSQDCLIQIGTWVLCRVHSKKRSCDNGWRRNYDHFTTAAGASDTDSASSSSFSSSSSSSSSSSDSDSSVLSEVSSSSDDSKTNTRNV